MNKKETPSIHWPIEDSPLFILQPGQEFRVISGMLVESLTGKGEILSKMRPPLTTSDTIFTVLYRNAKSIVCEYRANKTTLDDKTHKHIAVDSGIELENDKSRSRLPFRHNQVLPQNDLRISVQTKEDRIIEIARKHYTEGRKLEAIKTIMGLGLGLKDSKDYVESKFQ